MQFDWKSRIIHCHKQQSKITWQIKSHEFSCIYTVNVYLMKEYALLLAHACSRGRPAATNSGYSLIFVFVCVFAYVPVHVRGAGCICMVFAQWMRALFIRRLWFILSNALWHCIRKHWPTVISFILVILQKRGKVFEQITKDICSEFFFNQ